MTKWMIRCGSLQATVEAETLEEAFIKAIKRQSPEALGHLVAGRRIETAKEKRAGLYRYVWLYLDPIVALKRAGLMEK